MLIFYLIIYNIFIRVYYFVALIMSLFNLKAKLWINGRKNIWTELKNIDFKNKKTIWFHCASLGEYEQGLPIISSYKKNNPKHFIIISFFSPSGYSKIKLKNNVDYVIYLPIDTKKNMQKIIKIINPKLVIIVKYEYWYYFLKNLHKNKIPVILVSSVFLKSQIFFKWYGKLHLKMLKFFTFIFVQNLQSKILITDKLKLNNIIIAGDTRFDRVVNNIHNINNYDWQWLLDFKQNLELFIVGSSWQMEEEIILNIYKKTNNIKYIIVPHEITECYKLKNKFYKSILFSNIDINTNLTLYNVVIIDCIGLLSTIYSFADYVFIGGGFTKSGIHNILEPAVYGKLIFSGYNFKKYFEATELYKLNGFIIINNNLELLQNLHYYQNNKRLKQEKELISKNFVYINTGATDKILNKIKEIKI